MFSFAMIANLQGGLRPALLFLGFATSALAAETPGIRWVSNSATSATAIAVGVPDNWLRAFERLDTDSRRAEIFGVFAEQAGPGAMPAMAGSWQVAGQSLRFEPRFPLTRGVRYRAELRLPGAAPVIARFELPPDLTPSTTTVAQIYPSGREIPENQLKFYVHFTAPMTRGSVYQHVQIREANDGVIDLPFLELEEELWDAAMTRLTLLIDPGRIKRGVKPLEDVGPVFEAGKTYFLTIKAGWRDAAGRPLRGEVRHSYRVGPADRTPPDPARWQIRPPKPDTRGVLMVLFDEPMDHALAERLLTVRAGRGEGPAVEGEVEVGARESTWKFAPAQPWAKGRYALTIATTIEDLAGNNIGKTFDVDLSEGGPRRLEKRSVSLEFEVK